MTAREDLDPLEKLDAMINLVFDVLTSDPQLAKVVINEQSHLNPQLGEQSFMPYYNQFFKASQKVFDEGTENGFINSNIDINIFLHFVHGGLRYLINIWSRDGGEKLDVSAMQRNVKFFVKHGVLKW